MNIIIILMNIIQEILSTQKTLSIVRGQIFRSTILKVIGVMVSTLATAIVLGNKIDKQLLHNTIYIAIGVILGSIITAFLDRKNRKPQTFKYTVKFATNDDKVNAMNKLAANDIDNISIGSKTLIAYANDKQESRYIKMLKNIAQMECTIIRHYNIEEL